MEGRWKAPADPFGLPRRDTHVRAMRAFPHSSADACTQVLAELALWLDFVVADKDSGLQAALAGFHGSEVGSVPSR